MGTIALELFFFRQTLAPVFRSEALFDESTTLHGQAMSGWAICCWRGLLVKESTKARYDDGC